MALKRNNLIIRKGFTLIELVVVVLVISIISALAVPKMTVMLDETRAVSEITNINMVVKAIKIYKEEHGVYPRDANQMRFPVDLEGYVPKMLFTNLTPSGYQYDWDGPPPHTTIYMKIVIPADQGPASSTDLYNKLEQLYDDGNTDQGWITAVAQQIKFSF